MAVFRHFRHCTFWKLIVILVLATIMLQTWHMMMLFQLESKVRYKSSNGEIQNEVFPGKNDTSQGQRQETGGSIEYLMKKMWEKVRAANVFDQSGSYVVIDNILEGSNIEENRTQDVTIVTQCSSNHLHHLLTLSKIWNGPISVSVFTHDQDTQFAIYTIAYLIACVKNVSKQVLFHIAIPVQNLPIPFDLHDTTVSCNDRTDTVQSKSEHLNYGVEGVEYPNNLLRNIAIHAAKTSFVFIIDIDTLPSPDLRVSFNVFIKRHKQFIDSSSPIAFVVPSFEVNSKVDISSIHTKTDLKKVWSDSKVRPFYFELCWKCQRYTDYEQWGQLPDFDFLEIGYFVDWEDPWEPFFIAKKSDLPLYDERFRQYGFNRISQVCESYVKGFRFAVLNNAFLLHHEFKVPKNFHAKKEEEQNRNRQLFREFKKELKLKYPMSDRSC
ncbi:hypothetical protein CHS0354_003748 [Potamilus streckersoni]|uniref:Beta-1,4-glucuronyltransferase 1 n=1 Tax=Potamilus streckersoni TaxID=2493646 RepID=A0AAE0VYP8_9BIVA|nr:hypothetical protein CHS0354_003748 [Potamilus streckersoni]